MEIFPGVFFSLAQQLEVGQLVGLLSLVLNMVSFVLLLHTLVFLLLLQLLPELLSLRLLLVLFLAALISTVFVSLGAALKKLVLVDLDVLVFLLILGIPPYDVSPVLLRELDLLFVFFVTGAVLVFEGLQKTNLHSLFPVLFVEIREHVPVLLLALSGLLVLIRVFFFSSAKQFGPDLVDVLLLALLFAIEVFGGDDFVKVHLIAVENIVVSLEQK